MKTKFNFFAILLSLMFFVASCTADSELVDLCAETNCQNGGTCLDGSCQCPDGYYGSNCELEKTPTKVRISNIYVLEFPNFDPQGNAWDNSVSGPLPDIYVSILKKVGNSFQLVYDHPEYYASSWSPGVFDFPVEVYTTDVNTPFIIAIKDYDGADIPANEDDNVGEVAFFPYEPNTGFPAKRTISVGGVKVDIHLQYIFD